MLTSGLLARIPDRGIHAKDHAFLGSGLIVCAYHQTTIQYAHDRGDFILI